MTAHAPHRKTWPALLVLASMAQFLAAGCGNTEAKLSAQPDAAAKAVAVTVAKAEERMLPMGLDVTGTLMADAQTDIASEIEQRVVEVLVERGQFVNVGQVVARMHDQDAKNQLREAEASEAQIRERLGLVNGQTFDPLRTPEVQQARASMDRAEADYRRFVQLLEEGAVSRAEHDLRRADSLAAKAQYETAINQMRQLYQSLLAQKVRVAMGRKAMEDTVIRAPFSGVIAEKAANVGRYTKKGDRIATIVRIDPLRIELTIPEGAVAAVRKGQKVSFAVQSHPDRQFEGTIAYVGPAVRTESRVLVVEAIVPNPRELLQPGLFATARIELPAARPSVMVPAAAVKNEGGVFKLFVANEATAEVRIVQTGREAGGSVEILRGLSAGERVVSSQANGLTDGAAIAVQEAK
ncbi:MAG: efflux RND transporter periplasmic adaptor subunit [candidate division NC10 bacterium]|nr:efflux RND transporter periplasmic adaptor subunit [candidate division NC10 bacterium]MBI2456772.1 efflux RND transporter periplasmic adaptor subunit [candidate division NC10 bacterium]